MLTLFVKVDLRASYTYLFIHIVDFFSLFKSNIYTQTLWKRRKIYGIRSMLTLFGLHLQMTSMRSVSPWGLHVQSLSVHNSPSSCDIDGDINKKHNTKYMQIFVLESFTQCLKWHVSIMFNENHFILNYKVSVSLT